MYVNLNKFKAQVQAAMEEGTGLFGAMKSQAPSQINTPPKAVSFLSKAKNILQSMPAASKTTKFGIGAIVVAALAYVGFIRSATPQKTATARTKPADQKPTRWEQFQANASSLVKEYPRTTKVIGLAAGAGILFLGSKLLKNNPAPAPKLDAVQGGGRSYFSPEELAAYEEQASLFCPEMEIYPTSLTNSEVPEDALESGSRWEYPEFEPEVASQTLKHTPALHQEFVKRDMTANSSGPALLAADAEIRELASAPAPSTASILERIRNELKPALEKEKADSDMQRMKGLVAPFGTKVEQGNGITSIINNNVMPVSVEDAANASAQAREAKMAQAKALKAFLEEDTSGGNTQGLHFQGLSEAFPSSV